MEKAMDWKNNPGTPYAKLREGASNEVIVSDDGIIRGYSIVGWSFYQGDRLLFSVSKNVVGESPDAAVLVALLDFYDHGVVNGQIRGEREGKRCLQGDLRRTLGITAPTDETDDLLEYIHRGFISREEAERSFAGMPARVTLEPGRIDRG